MFDSYEPLRPSLIFQVKPFGLYHNRVTIVNYTCGSIIYNCNIVFYECNKVSMLQNFYERNFIIILTEFTIITSVKRTLESYVNYIDSTGQCKKVLKVPNTLAY